MAVRPSDVDRVAGNEGAEIEEDGRAELRRVHVPDDHRVAGLAGAGARLVPAGLIGLLQRGTWTVPSGLVPSDMIVASTPIRGISMLVGAERSSPAGTSPARWVARRPAER
ncbi:hypothetical protein GCM10027614_34490 [Micromonospora vulcania]